MCVGNRSATLFEMGEWKKCLDDIEGRYLFTKLESYLNLRKLQNLSCMIIYGGVR